MNSVFDLLKLTDEYLKYLKEKQFMFDESGFPIFSQENFLDEMPEMVIPYDNRNCKFVTNSKKTLLCFFTSDKRIYPRLKNIFHEIDIYKRYMGVVIPDLTVTGDMDSEWQEYTLLVNHLFAAILAVNGVKIVINTRLGSIKNLHLLKHIPQYCVCASGFLGCNKSSKNDYTYVEKILSFLPSDLIIYGKEDKTVNDYLDNLGINYKYYLDYHRLCKERRI